MVDVYDDESDSGTTYAGWLTAPSGWDHFEPRWQEMLDTTAMADGSRMPAFDAAEIVEREKHQGQPGQRLELCCRN